MKFLDKSALAFLLSMALSACGGGSSVSNVEHLVASTAIINAAPTANASLDQKVVVGSIVTLDAGSSSDANGDALTFRWRFTAVPAGSTAVFSSTTVTRPTFVPDVAGVFTASLIANDGKSDSTSDVVSITATAKTATTIVPIANPGPNQSVLVGTTVNLNGIMSSSVNGHPLTYRWTLLSKPTGSAFLLNPFSATPTFVADSVGTYAALLLVNNVIYDSTPATVIITAVAAPSISNTPPIANAGTDKNVLTGSIVSLDGSLSKDLNGDHLTYAWSFVSRPQFSMASINLPASVNPTFLADISGAYDVQLIVNDGEIDSIAGDIISVIAVSANAAKIADTGIYRCASLSKAQALSLYAQGHIYLDRDHDGKPCELNDILNETTSSYVAPSTGASGQCYVNGYYRKSGTYVHGYYRSC